jgi:hypothetical protein
MDDATLAAVKVVGDAYRGGDVHPSPRWLVGWLVGRSVGRLVSWSNVNISLYDDAYIPYGEMYAAQTRSMMRGTPRRVVHPTIAYGMCDQRIRRGRRSVTTVMGTSPSSACQVVVVVVVTVEISCL